MTPDVFRTHSLPAPDQFDAWRGWFGSVFDVVPREPPRQGFLAETAVWTLDGFGLSRVRAPSIMVSRSAALIRRNPVDHWVITIGRRAVTSVRMGDATVDAPAGSPFVLSLGTPLVSDRSQDERLQLYMARDSFRELTPVLDAARGIVLDTPLGNLLADYMVLLERTLPDLTNDQAPRLTRALGAMVGACIVPSADRIAAAGGQIDLGRLERVRRAVRRYLRSPALGPSLLCRHVGMSRSQLYRLMEAEGGVARYIQRQRLLESYAALSDLAADKPISAIAHDLCFADASGFSRAFRQEFGITPSEVRAAARAGMPAAMQPKDRDGFGVRSLSDCLRAF
jgi:AraC-like DNA-binding protein